MAGEKGECQLDVGVGVGVVYGASHPSPGVMEEKDRGEGGEGLERVERVERIGRGGGAEAAGPLPCSRHCRVHGSGAQHLPLCRGG